MGNDSCVPNEITRMRAANLDTRINIYSQKVLSFNSLGTQRQISAIVTSQTG